MKKQRTIFILVTLAAIAICSACCKRLMPSITERIVVRDSLVQLLRDTTIYVEVERQSSANTVLTTDTSHLENRYATSMAYIAENRLYHSLVQKQQQLPFNIKYVDKYHTVVRDSVRVEHQVQEVNRLTHWQSFRLVLGNIFGALLLAVVVWVVLRFWLRKG